MREGGRERGGMGSIIYFAVPTFARFKKRKGGVARKKSLPKQNFVFSKKGGKEPK